MLGREQGAQAGEAVGVDQAGGREFGQCHLELGVQQSAVMLQFIEEGRGVCANTAATARA